MLQLLNAGPPHPHTNAATVFAASATLYSATSANSVVLTLASGTQARTLGTNIACCRFVTVHNLETAGGTMRVYVNVSNTAEQPPSATAGSFAIPAGGSMTFVVPGGGNKGYQAMINCLATAGGTTGSIQWHP